MGKGSAKLSANEIAKKHTRTCPGQQKLQSYLSKGLAGNEVFFRALPEIYDIILMGDQTMVGFCRIVNPK